MILTTKEFIFPNIENLNEYMKIKTKESFVKELNESLNKHIANKDLDAGFFNDFDISKDNKEINAYLNERIPGKWYMIALFGNGTNMGKGIFYEPEYDVYLDLSCYGEDDEWNADDYIDDFYVDEECGYILDKEILDNIEKLKNKYA